jgi:hypothetical protein
MHKLTLFFLLLFAAHFAFGTTTIKCENADYAGRKLDFYFYTDPVTKESKFAFSLKFDKSGKSIATTNYKTTGFVFCDFDIYHGMLFIEPGKTVEILLPPVHEKSFADQKNPYFSPAAFWFKTKNNNQLNDRISDFTQQFNRLTNKYFNQLYFRQSKEIYDSLTYFIDKQFGDIHSETFLFHKKSKLKMVVAEAFREKPEQFSNYFANAKSKFWLYPSFIDIFEKAFNNQLSFVAKSVKEEDLRKAVNGANIQVLQKFVKNRYSVSGEMADLVTLKLLHDAYYSNQFSKTAIRKMVKNEKFTKNGNKIVKVAALRCSAKFTHLQKGTPAPVICLKDISGQQVCTNKEKTKFKYIIFADTEMIVCREQLKYLTNIQQRFQKYLEIFVVLRKTDEPEMKKFLDKNKIVGTKLIDTNGEFISGYKIKSFPQCFLLNENHEVQFTATKTPLEGFEQQFGKFLQNELFMRQRNQSEK